MNMGVFEIQFQYFEYGVCITRHDHAVAHTLSKAIEMVVSKYPDANIIIGKHLFKVDFVEGHKGE